MATHRHSKSNQTWSPPSDSSIIDLTEIQNADSMDISMFANSAFHEMKLLLVLWIKISCCNLLEMLPLFTGKMFVGHIPNTNSALLLSAVGLAQIYTNITAMSVGWGFTSGLLTLIPQCIGSNRLDLMATYAQRAFYITLFVLIISTILQIYSGDILCLILGFHKQSQNSQICEYITMYCLYLIPFMFCTVWFTILQRIIQNLDYNTHLLCIVFICNTSAPVLNYILIIHTMLSYLGAAITMNCTILAMLIASVALLWYKGYGHIFKPISIRQVLDPRKVWQYLKLTIPGVVLTCMSWWIGEFITILSGVVYDPYIAISSTVICYSLFEILLEFSVGLGNAVNIRIGKFIGCGSIFQAKRSGKVAVFLGFIWAVIVVMLLLLLKDFIPRIYTNDERIVSMTSDLMYFLAVICVCFLFFKILSSIYQGLGQPFIVAVITFIAQIIGLILTFVFLWGLDCKKYVDLGLYSIWSCATFGYLLAVLTILWMLGRKYETIWIRAVNESNQRSQKTLIQTNTNDYGSVPNTVSVVTNRI